MKFFSKNLLLGALMLLLNSSVNAQLNGSYSIPGAYPDISSALAALVSSGVSGPVTFNVSGIQKAPSGGYIINPITGASSINTVKFIASGSASIEGDGTAATNDAIIKLIGCDNVTIEGFTMTVLNNSVEWGVALLNQSATDGVQNCTIKNNSFTLDKTNTAATTGIYGAHVNTSGTTVTPLSAAGAHSNNIIIGNTISNVITGIGLGVLGASTTYWDTDNIVGQSGSGNTITNFANAAVQSYGIRCEAQANLQINYNIIDNTSVAGNTGTLDGIYFTNGAAQNAVVTNNTVKLTRALGTSQWAGIRNIGYTGTVNISNNILSDWTMPTGTAVATPTYMIYNNSATVSYNIDNNQIKDCISFNTTSTIYVVYNAGATSGAISCSNNTVNNIKKISATGSLYVLYNSSSTTTGGTETITGNQISNIGGNGVTTTGTMYMIYSTTNAAQTRTIANNTISYVACGTVYCCYSGTAGNGTINNNTVSNISSTSSLNLAYATSAISVISNNQLTGNVVSGTGTANGIYSSSATSTDIFGNTLNITSSGTGTVYGCYLTSSVTEKLFNNNISVSSAATTNPIYGIYVAGGTTSNIYNNNVLNVQSLTFTTGSANGIYLGATTNNCYNNLVSGIAAPTSTTGSAVNGINCAGTTTNVYYNTIKLTGSVVSGASGIFWNAASATNVNTLVNNIISVDITLTAASGARSIACIRKGPSATGSLGAATNNNIYNIPINADAYIYIQGTTTLTNGFSLDAVPTTGTGIVPFDFNTGCNAYRTFMSPKESSSFFENIPLGGATGMVPTAGIITYAESSAASIPLVTTDFTGATRSATSDIGAYEFSGTIKDASGPTISFTPLQSNTICLTNPVITATITDPSNVNTTTAIPRLWFKKGANTDALPLTNDNTTDGWKYVEATGTSPFTFTFNYSLLYGGLPTAGEVISYFIVAQDMSSAMNIGVKQASFATGYCATTVALGSGAFPLIGTPPNSFTIGALGTINTLASPSNTVCVGGSINFTVGGGSVTGADYQWQESFDGMVWNDISSATNTTYSKYIDVNTVNLYYRCDFRCGGISIGASTTSQIIVSNPLLTSTTPKARCGTGTVDLEANSATGIINWYAAPTGGNPIGSGNTFTTPVISTTTDFYASPISTTTSATLLPGDGGWNHITTIGAYQTTTIANAYMTVNITQTTTLNSMDIYPTNAPLGSTFTIQARTGSASGTVVLSYTGTTTVQNAGGTVAPTTAQTVPVSWVLTPGTYYIGFSVNPGAWRSGLAGIHNYPWTYPGYVSVSHYLTPNYQYFFYNLNFELPCEGTRTAVTATVNTPPAVTLPATISRCSTDAPTAISAASSNAGYTYAWSPAVGLSSTTGANVTSNIAGNIKYNVTATDNSGGAYSGCVALASVDVAVGITPATPIVTSSVIPGTPCNQISSLLAKSASTVVVGTGTSSSANYSPYKVNFGAAKIQYLYLASELNALGLNPNQLISSIGFEVGAYTGGLYTMKNFTINMANVSTSVLTATLQTPTFTTCFSGDFVIENISNAFLNHTLSTPFVWNGTDNILVEVCYDSNDAGTSSAATVKYNLSGSSLCTFTTGSDNSGVYCSVITTGTATSNRPNTKFNYGLNTTTWSPATGLFTDAPLSVPYTTGSSATQLYAAPSVATTYTVEAQNGTCSNLAPATKMVAASEVNIILTTLGSQSSTATCDKNSWTYYGNGIETYFAINWAPDGTLSAANSLAKNTAAVSLNLEAAAASQTGATQTVKSMKRYWNVINSGVFDEPVNIKFFYDAAEFNEIENDLSLTNKTWFKTVGSNFAGVSSMVNGVIPNAIPLSVTNSGTENGVNFVQFDGITSFSGGTYAGATVASPLPINLKTFTAKEKGSVNQINWETSVETNVRSFEIEKSNDGKVWTKLGSMNPNQTKRYEMIDGTPSTTTYYRLKNIDNDGRTDVSSMVVVNRKTGRFTLTSVSPNPTSSDLTVKYESSENTVVTMNVLDLFGRVLLTQKADATKGFNTSVVNTSELPAGAYFLNINDGVNTLTQRVVKQ